MMPKDFVISADQAGRRIDNYLLFQLKNVPRGLLYRLLRQGRITVNHKKVKPSYRLQEADQIKMVSLKIPLSEKIREKPTPSLPSIKKLTQRVLYEDDNLLVLDKPVGMAVHGGTHIPLGVIDVLRYARKEENFLELAHRLDRETSGCLIIAKKRSVLRELHQLLREGSFQKTYYALTLGHWPKINNRIEVNLMKNRLSSGERKVKVNEAGKLSITDFRVIRSFPQADFVEVTLHTGRTHQIRVHAAHAGHPLAGDEKYGDRAFNRVMKQKGLKRLFLQASHIQFMLPSRNKEISVDAPLDEELSEALETL